MKKSQIIFLLIALILVGCKEVVEEAPVDIPVYKFNYSPAVKLILPAIYTCAAEFPDVIFRPEQNYYAVDALSFQLGEPEMLPNVLIALAYDEIVLITHPSNPITEWDDFRIVNIMNGRIDNWDYLGWDGEVQIWLPSPEDEVYDLFDLNVLDGNPIAISTNYASSHQLIVETVSDDIYAVGVVPASFTNSGVQTHSLNIRVPVLALFNSELDQVQNDFLACMQNQAAQSDLEKSYEILP